MNENKEDQSNQEVEDLQMQVELLTNAKTELQQQLIQSNLDLSDAKKSETASINRAMKVHEENTLIKSSENIAQLKAMLDYELALATHFASLKKIDPSAAYVVIKAGEEMGLNPVVAMNMLYIVNGSIKAYGDKMLGYILSKGFTVKYVDETEKSVTVILTDREGVEYKETATDNDQIIIKSMVKGAASFAKKNKLRFHAIRMIASFHLPHLFMGCSDEFSSDFKDFQQGQLTKDKDGTITVDAEHVEILNDHHQGMINCESEDELDQYYIDNKMAIAKNIKLLSFYGKRKGEFENQENQDNHE